ncbi:hypothetical protein SCALM49S_03186 [Streptomyces californicus]
MESSGEAASSSTASSMKGGSMKAHTGSCGILGSISPPGRVAPKLTREPWMKTSRGAIAWSSDSGPTSACGTTTPTRATAPQPSSRAWNCVMGYLLLFFCLSSAAMPVRTSTGGGRYEGA